ncbi:MAG TPA: hypothetical protein DC049_01765 [Spirochaetia bacterium]|nr:hypothetical protein [Spirochaetia bacterium]
MTEEQWKALIAEITAGHTEKFSIVINHFRDKIFRMCIKRLKNHNEALDACQEIFLEIYKSLASFKGKSQFATWIYSLSFFTCSDFKKKREKISRHENPSENYFQMPLTEDFPLHFAEQELIKQVEKDMPDSVMELLHLKITHNFSYEEIAGILKISVNRVKTRLFRARKKFFSAYRHFSGKNETK